MLLPATMIDEAPVGMSAKGPAEVAISVTLSPALLPLEVPEPTQLS